jgi:type IV secretion system protein VirD4
LEPKKKSKSFDIIVSAVTFVLAVYIALQGAAAYAFVSDAGLVGFEVFGEVLSELERRVAGSPFSFEWTDVTSTYLVVILLAWFIAVVYFITTRRKLIIGKEHGTAEWGDKKDISDLFAVNILKGEITRVKKKFRRDRNKREEEIRLLKQKYYNADMHLTATERASIYNYKTNNHVLVIGGSGSGKTRYLIMPNILQLNSSFVATDPKGEVLEKCGHLLEQQGYLIRVLNLFNLEQSDYYNSFYYLHPDNAYPDPKDRRPGYEERVLTLIDALIINTDGGKKRESSDPFWEKAERLFLQAIFFAVCDGFLPEYQNMNTAIWLIKLLQLKEDGDNKDSDLDYFFKEFAKKHGEDHIGVVQYNEFRGKAAGKTAMSIVISAVARLAPFQTKEMKRIVSHDTMMLQELGERKMAIFVVVPPTGDTFNFVSGLLFTQMFQELQYCASIKYKDKGQRLPVPVRFLLDEFANTCVIPKFVEILAYARSFGVGIVPVFQSFDQIKKLYEKDVGVFVDNCSYLLFLGRCTHGETLEYLSKLLGKGTFDKRSSSRTYGSKGSSSKSWDTLGRELMMPDEIRKMPDDKCLLIASGRKPFYSTKYDYTSHPNYHMTSDGGAGSYDYKPKIVNIDDYKNKYGYGDRPHGEDGFLSHPGILHGDVVYTGDDTAFVTENEIKAFSSIKELLGSLRGIFNRKKLKPISDEKMGGLDDGDVAGASNSVISELLDEFRGDGGKGAVDSGKALSAVIDPLEIIADTLPRLHNLKPISDFKMGDDSNIDVSEFEADDDDVLEYDFEDDEVFCKLLDELVDVLDEVVDQAGGAGDEVA